MKTKITLGDVFVSRLWSGEIYRETLPNHAVRYHGLIEPIDRQRFSWFIETPAAKHLFDCLDEVFDPDDYENSLWRYHEYA